MKMELFDTTFRDGLQEEGISAKRLDQTLLAISAIDALGVAYHELGFAAWNTAAKFRIQEALKLVLKGKVCAFGRTHHDDVEAILHLGVPVGVLVGKTRLKDANIVIRKDPRENLDCIDESVESLVSSGREVIYDAEHFFQAFYEDDEDYALETLETARRAGALRIVLCDTNGKMTPEKISQAIRKVSEKIPKNILGIHCHNDRGRATANTEAAWLAGIAHIQGTFGGFGERTGNADLVTLIANLVLDYGAEGVSKEQLKKLKEVYLLVCGALGQSPNPKHPYVGSKAFYTEAGMHQSGLERDFANYWHIEPGVIGNVPRVGATDQSGRANITAKAKEFGISIPEERFPAISCAFNTHVNDGYDFVTSDASLELFLRRCLGLITEPFEFLEYEISSRSAAQDTARTTATLRVILDNERLLHNADGDGPINALDAVLRRTLWRRYPDILSVRLTDYHVDVFDVEHGTAAKVQVYIQWSDGKTFWNTMAAHENIIEASWLAIRDGYVYKLSKLMNPQ